MSAMWGAADYPVIYTSHPIGSLDRQALRRRAEELVDQVVAVVMGVEVSQIAPVQ